MVHILATIANDAEYMPALLYALRGQVRIPDTVSSAETWGVGYFADERALIVRKPSSILEERSAFGIARNLRSHVVLTCARCEHEQADAPPFRFRRWLFGYVGNLDALGGLQNQIAPKLPDFVQDLLGEGHGGRLAHGVFLTELHRAGLLEDPLADPADLGGALERTAETLVRLAPEAGVDDMRICFAASNGRMLVVTRAGLPLWMREVQGLENLPDGPVDETLHDFKRIAEALKRFRAHVVALDVEAAHQTDWTRLEARGSTVFDASLQTTSLKS